MPDSRFSFLRRALGQDDEFSIDYLLGVHSEKYQGVVGKKGLRGCLLRSIRLFYKYARQIGRERQADISVLFYAGTLNQLRTLEPVSESMNDVRHTMVVRSGLRDIAKPGAVAYQVHPLDYLAAVWFSLTHGICLFWTTSRERRKLLAMAADRFFQCYFDLLIMRRLIRQSRCQMLVLANDHNPDCRSMLLAARIMNVKTVYLQHATVSADFPPLEMDYAFLDGVSALRIYEKIHTDSGRSTKKFACVFLNGQKKRIARWRRSGDSGKICVGVSLNRLDDLGELQRLLDVLQNLGASMLVRPHPGDTRKIDIERMTARFSAAQYSNPRLHGVDTFLSRIDVQVAADSSIHLEAMLAGVVSYYYRLGGEIEEDYYGFVRSGMIEEFPLVELRDNRLDASSLAHPLSPQQCAAVRRYSETFRTSWQGREGLLAALTIKELLGMREASLYKKSRCSDIYEVFRLEEQPSNPGGIE